MILAILKKNEIKKNNLFFIASAVTQTPIQKVDMMYLSKEATNEDQSLKIQMVLSLDKKDTSNNSEKICKKMFFWRQKRGFYHQKS